MKSLVGTAGVFSLGMIFSFIFNWSITKYLPQKEVGFFQYFISIITFAMVIVPLGYQSLAQREVINLNRKSLIKLSSQATLAIIVGSVVFSFVWFLTYFLWFCLDLVSTWILFNLIWFSFDLDKNLWRRSVSELYVTCI